MDSRRFRHFVLCGIFAASLSSFGPGAIDAQETAHTPKPPPKLLAPRIPTSPPTLADPKRPASESVPTFVDWASRSVIGQREEARKIIVAARDNPAVAEELCREIFEVQKDDLSRSLIMLSVLGEMRNPDGGKCLARFLHQPFPKEGTVVNGEIVEQTSLGVPRPRRLTVSLTHTRKAAIAKFSGLRARIHRESFAPRRSMRISGIIRIRRQRERPS
jgi:hypothetical protein